MRNPDAEFRVGLLEIALFILTAFALLAIPAARAESDSIQGEKEIYKANMRMKAVRALARAGRYIKRLPDGETAIVDGPVRP